MLERHLVERHGEAQRGDPFEQCVEHDLKLGARELLPDALMAAVFGLVRFEVVSAISRKPSDPRKNVGAASNPNTIGLPCGSSH